MKEKFSLELLKIVFVFQQYMFMYDGSHCSYIYCSCEILNICLFELGDMFIHLYGFLHQNKASHAL